MSTDEIRRDDHDGVITLTMTRDDKMNAMTPGMFVVLEQAVRDLGDRDDLRVLVIAAEGRFFTAGLDVSSLRLDVGTGTDGTVRGSNIRRQYRAEAHHDLFDEIEQVEKPVVLAAQYQAASLAHDPDHKDKKTRLDWGEWVDWARPTAGHVATPSWIGRADVPRVTNLRDMDFGERNE